MVETTVQLATPPARPLTAARLQLRLNKVSELIHNSSEHRDLQQARVSVFFEEIIDKVRTPRSSHVNSTAAGHAAAAHFHMPALPRLSRVAMRPRSQHIAGHAQPCASTAAARPAQQAAARSASLLNSTIFHAGH